LLRWQFFDFFQDGGHLPSWICDARVWTIHEEYLVIFIAVQNLAGIGVVVFEDMRVSILYQFGLEMPIHVTFGGVFRVKIRVMGNVLQF